MTLGRNSVAFTGPGGRSALDCKVGTATNNVAQACADCGPGFDLSRGGLFGPCSSFACPRGTTDSDSVSSTACEVPGAEGKGRKGE